MRRIGLKVHCNGLHLQHAYANDRPICGQQVGWISIGRDVYRDRSVRLTVFQCLPKTAQCVSCRGLIPQGWMSATAEQITAVEYGLVMLSRIRWDDPSPLSNAARAIETKEVKR